MDEIRIKGLEVYAYHGVYQDEKEKGQIFRVNAVLYTDTHAAGVADDLELSTDYGAVCKLINEQMKVHTYDLLETVAEQLCRDILLNFDLIKEVEIEICKPQAPIGLPFEDVSVCIRRGWHKVYLAVGSNMGDREGYIRQGIQCLWEHESIRRVRESALIETKPYGDVEQDDFLNGALELETMLSPRKLLEVLHQIEAAAGRERLVHWGPRTLDLDIIFYDKLVYESDDLVIPHVDMQNRVFVLQPLCELAPNYRHPVFGRTVSELLRAAASAE
ncbi:MAG: 2-amino-4-hydroxy-6-hydroxymethyldihydropteridine diphosphokinase [Lachnospiraceae bacterium]|nr:2-amino-4-hydroxy-6-hydroxymethyldihydropteridine diphosphokinase [Lachnospiraceae bacterium]